MAESPLRLIKRCVEFQPKERVKFVPKGRRGLYVLYRDSKAAGEKKAKKVIYDVVYVGMATQGMRGRLESHAKKKADWTHFSAFEVWDNIRDEEIVELEGLFRHLYRHDSHANGLAVQKMFKKLKRTQVPINDLGEWPDSSH